MVGSQSNKDQIGEGFAMTKTLFPDQIDEKRLLEKVRKSKTRKCDCCNGVAYLLMLPLTNKVSFSGLPGLN